MLASHIKSEEQRNSFVAMQRVHPPVDREASLARPSELRYQKCNSKKGKERMSQKKDQKNQIAPVPNACMRIHASC